MVKNLNNFVPILYTDRINCYRCNYTKEYKVDIINCLFNGTHTNIHTFCDCVIKNFTVNIAFRADPKSSIDENIILDVNFYRNDFEKYIKLLQQEKLTFWKNL